MKKLLCILNGLNNGGAETFLMKIYRKLDKEKYQIDFCLSSEEDGIYEQEAVAMGSRLYRLTPKTKNFIKNFLQIRGIVKSNQYISVMRMNEHSLAVPDLIAAKCGGAKKLVMRSSNADSGSRRQRLFHKLFIFLPKLVPNVKIAPSTKAAEYTFGKGCVKKGKVHFLKNGLFVEKYTFNKAIRDELRKDLQLEDKFVIGHIGRFQKQKNHKFLIEVFKGIAKKKEDAVLVLVGGNGELLEETKAYVKKLGLSEKVVFLGNRSDVPRLLSVFDVLVFPSFFEGMPNVVIEAQAAGLPCLISDTITKEADVTGIVKYYSLEKSPLEWAEEAVKIGTSIERKSYVKEFKKAGYDIESVVNRFTELVF